MVGVGVGSYPIAEMKLVYSTAAVNWAVKDKFVRGGYAMCMCNSYLPMTRWVDEIETAVHPVINDMPPVQATLVMEVTLKLFIDVLNYWLEATRKKTDKEKLAQKINS